MSNTTENKGAALLSFGILLTMLITLSASYVATIAEISIEWSGNGVYSYGFLALLIAIYIAWQERKLQHTISSDLLTSSSFASSKTASWDVL
jgi:hypothetical protein